MVKNFIFTVKKANCLKLQSTYQKKVLYKNSTTSQTHTEGVVKGIKEEKEHVQLCIIVN